MRYGLMIVTLLGFMISKAQVKSGSLELDATFGDINATAKTDPSGFKAKLSLDFGVPVPKIEGLLLNMSPADVTMSLVLSNVSAQPVDQVVTVYNKHKSKGWGEIAKELGIKPGSAEFHKLKEMTKGKSKEMKGNAKPKTKGKPENAKPVKGNKKIQSK